jgi:thymidine phosphorylase
VAAGEVLARIHAANSDSAEQARARLAQAFEISDTQPNPPPLIAEILIN